MPIDKTNLEEMDFTEMVAPTEVEPINVEVVSEKAEVSEVANESSAPQVTVTEKKTVGRRGGQRSERAKNIITELNSFFEEMKSGDKVNNHDLVKHLDGKGFEVGKSAIPTDVPLNYAPKTDAMINGIVTKIKDDPDKKRPMWMYLRK